MRKKKIPIRSAGKTLPSREELWRTLDNLRIVGGIPQGEWKRLLGRSSPKRYPSALAITRIAQRLSMKYEQILTGRAAKKSKKRT